MSTKIATTLSVFNSQQQNQHAHPHPHHLGEHSALAIPRTLPGTLLSAVQAQLIRRYCSVRLSGYLLPPPGSGSTAQGEEEMHQRVDGAAHCDPKLTTAPNSPESGPSSAGHMSKSKDNDDEKEGALTAAVHSSSLPLVKGTSTTAPQSAAHSTSNFTNEQATQLVICSSMAKYFGQMESFIFEQQTQGIATGPNILRAYISQLLTDDEQASAGAAQQCSFSFNSAGRSVGKKADRMAAHSAQQRWLQLVRTAIHDDLRSLPGEESLLNASIQKKISMLVTTAAQHCGTSAMMGANNEDSAATTTVTVPSLLHIEECLKRDCWRLAELPFFRTILEQLELSIKRIEEENEDPSKQFVMKHLSRWGKQLTDTQPQHPPVAEEEEGEDQETTVQILFSMAPAELSSSTTVVSARAQAQKSRSAKSHTSATTGTAMTSRRSSASQHPTHLSNTSQGAASSSLRVGDADSALVSKRSPLPCPCSPTWVPQHSTPGSGSLFQWAFINGGDRHHQQ